MALGLTRREQWALLGVVGVILAGLGVHAWRASQASGVATSDTVYVAGQGYWRKVADFNAGERPAPPADGRLAGGDLSNSAQTTETAPLNAAPPTTGSGQNTAAGGDGLIELNTATAEELERLPGIGPAKAAAIVQARTRLGGFTAIDQLDAVSGIGVKTLDKLRPSLRLGVPGRGAAEAAPTATTATTATQAAAPPATADTHIKLNTASAEELTAVKGIGPVLAARIIDERQRRGPFRAISDLRRVKGIGVKTLEKIAPQVVCE